MRHKIAGYKLSRTSSHRLSMLKNLLRSIVKYESIETTLQKAKFIQPKMDQLITIAKSYEMDKINTIRKLFSILDKKELIDKILDLSIKYKDRKGGYSRICKLGFRSGDKADIALISFV